MLDWILLLGVFLLLCSITPVSALEMSIELNSLPFTTTSSGDVFSLDNSLGMSIEGVSIRNGSNNKSNNTSHNKSNVNKTLNWGPLIVVGVIMLVVEHWLDQS